MVSFPSTSSWDCRCLRPSVSSCDSPPTTAFPFRFRDSIPSSNGALPELVRDLLWEEGAGCANVLAKRSLFNDDEFEGPKMLSVSDDITPSLVAAPPNGVDVDMIHHWSGLICCNTKKSILPGLQSRHLSSRYIFLRQSHVKYHRDHLGSLDFIAETCEYLVFQRSPKHLAVAPNRAIERRCEGPA